MKAKILLIIALVAVSAANAKNNAELRNRSDKFFSTEEARRIGRQVLAYQRVTGGWPKNVDMAEPMTEEQWARAAEEKNRTDDSTTDNLATTSQMSYLARLWQAQGGDEYRDAFGTALEYLLSGQYENGGWPQFWPNPQGYQVHITYNDAAMVNTMNLIREIELGNAPYGGGLVSAETRRRCGEAFAKGIDVTLKCQIRVNGRPTVWCQQHDRETFAPAAARAYELPSFCSLESALIVAQLMSLPDPTEEVKQAVHGAMRWFDDHKLTGLRVARIGEKTDPNATTFLQPDPEAGPLWGRFYDLETQRIYVCDRDGVPRFDLSQIGRERRNGYGWYNSAPALLYPMYDAWADRYDPARKEKISL